MSRTTKLLGTVSVLATLAASPAAAQIAGFAGFADASYSNISLDDSSSSDDSLSNVNLGLGVAFPVDEVDGIAWQLDGNYSSQSGDGFSRIVWNLGGSLWWGGMQSRLGININYNTLTDFGSLTNGGIFAEWYLGNFTIQGKGGWLWGGGTPNGGRGNYLGGGVVGYFVPNLAIGASAAWADLITGSTLSGGGLSAPPCSGATCGRRGFGQTAFSINGEFLVSGTLPISVFGGYTYTDYSLSENISNPSTPADDFSTSTFFIGVRYYMGMGPGTLIGLHRNGNLHGFLRGPL